MTALKRVLVITFVCAATMLHPHVAQAMTVEMFDAMAVEDQRDYLKLLVDRAHEVLIAQNRRDLAMKIEELFRTRRGERQSPGEAAFRRQLIIIRDYVSQQNVKNLRVQVLPGEVEAALIGSLQKNGIPMSHALFKALAQSWTAKPFWPQRPLRTAESEIWNLESWA